jgi:hypothetical protein
MFRTRRGLLAIILITLLWSGGWHLSSLFPARPHPDVTITDQARTHILYGDERGGGHISGAGKPCKSEFPVDWTSKKIIENTLKIASNDNLNWRQGRNGYYVSEEMIEGVNVRVVLDRERDHVVTAYPTNVERNPCVRTPANDNLNN